MCGIAGYINTDLQPVGDTSCIIPMLKAQKHRGPDDSGIKAFSLSSGQSLDVNVNEPSSVGRSFEGILGFNRLSILDLSSNGHQPMSSPDNKVILTLNGEIYNAFDYTHELEQWGYRFKSTSDTEVVLALYLKYGFEGMLARLNGMFAIVIADLGKKELYVTRDRFGIKPMYYILSDKLFAFSSELKSFMYLDGFNFELVEEQIDEYLLFRNNISGTLFRGIELIEPGQYLVYRHGRKPEARYFFDVESYTRKVDISGDMTTYGERLEEWLGKSVKGQLMSDVRLGCQLSGGIDSSLVTWLANRSTKGKNFEAVSIVFNDTRFSEEKYIDFVTENLGIPSHKFLLDSDYYIDNFEKATWHLESPINHPNTIGIYKLSQKAKDHVTVLLSGEGADEIFGGYTRFYDIGYPFRFRKLFNEARKNIKQPAGMAGYFDKESRAVMATAFMTPGMAGSLREGFNAASATMNRRSLYKTLSGSLFDRQVKYELKTYLPDLLIRQDKMSMAHSIENRVPFLDNELVENSFTIPEKFLLLRKSQEGKNTEKYLLKMMTAGKFGNDFAFRNKMGFGIPLREFFLNRKFTECLNDKILPGIKKRGLFSYPQAARWVSDLKKIDFSELEALWVVVSFEMWASIYLDKGIK